MPRPTAPSAPLRSIDPSHIQTAFSSALFFSSTFFSIHFGFSFNLCLIFFPFSDSTSALPCRVHSPPSLRLISSHLTPNHSTGPCTYLLLFSFFVSALNQLLTLLIQIPFVYLLPLRSPCRPPVRPPASQSTHPPTLSLPPSCTYLSHTFTHALPDGCHHCAHNFLFSSAFGLPPCGTQLSSLPPCAQPTCVRHQHILYIHFMLHSTHID